MERVRTALAVFYIVATGLVLSACSDVNFKSKKDLVSKSVFGDGQGPNSPQDPRAYNEDEHSGNGDGDGPGSPIVDGPAPGSPNGPPPEVHVDVDRDCSNNQTEDSGNIIEANFVSLRVYDKSGKVVCEGNKNYRTAFLNFDKMTFDVPCDVSKDGEYKFRFFDRNFINKEELGEVKLKRRNGKWEQGLKRLHVTYGPNYKRNNAGDGDYPEALGNLECEDFSSPLVVKLREDKPLKLSSPTEGIRFDIQGERGSHIKRQISWPVDDTIAFIALPDHNGSVHSVDQLFGDNTKGPDGRFAEHGYHALAKFDHNGDKRIDKEDAVYSKLRLFIDRNRDGYSQAGELSTLASHDIVNIDLEYDPDYSETDAYGNKILFKSVAETKDKDLLLIFDIWFRHID